LGIGPVNVEIDFQPNLVSQNTVYVVNSGDYSIPIKMSVEGELADYVKLNTYDFILGPKSTPSGIFYVDFTVSLPEKVEKPGTYKIWIFATENPEQTNTAGIGAKLRMGMPIFVYVPYPGKYVEFIPRENSVKIDNPNVNQTITFSIDAINRGNETIGDAKVIFSIYDPDDKSVTTFTTEGKPMPPSEKVTFTEDWLANNVRPGRYKLVTRMVYDGYRVEQTKEFLIGSPTAKIINLFYSPIVEGTIGKITADVGSEWNSRIPGMSILLEIRKGDFYTGVRSETFDLNPWQEVNITMFWDTSKIAGGLTAAVAGATISEGPGEYSGNATVYYLNGTHSVPFSLTVIPKGFQFTTENVLIILAVVLAIIFAVSALFYKRRSKKKFAQKRLM
jgi:hypothetical protein